MPSRQQPHFQPPPPIRTSTHDSAKSQLSGTVSPASDMMSPTSTFSRDGRSPVSPGEESFFGAIASRIRGRSRSRSRNRSSRERSKSPIMLPPEQMPPTSSAQPMSPTYTTQRQQQPRHVSHASQSSVTSTTSKPSRPSLQGPTRRSTSSSDMWRGRHSNSWLFNDFSVTDTAKDILHLRRKS
ncbi:uncharacterized protein BDR25DRAFT_229273 [Lindgomyces ingoldianus]|uniref:Uncharacterized protein n=1 Tax=Lindgomyces ingoldianus TaxID=673940 RepID=A0ACB6QR50_9PLEO|nr:uncharacterized protein BDR25DRAFT_229273 [Lindgomyces ingoldianus]KAF2469365.1 hypothetical protein BDR25DRAFT_229273 [Lindgomyces ingoldianus]